MSSIRRDFCFYVTNCNFLCYLKRLIMKTFLSKSRYFLQAGVVAAGLMVGSSSFALTLPAVTNCGYPAPYTNLLCYTDAASGTKLYVGSEHDDFISYSLNAMKQYSSNFGYTSLSEWTNLPTFGSGQIVKLFTFNESNNGGFPDATTGTNDNPPEVTGGDATAPKDGQYLGYWPEAGSVTVKDLKDYLGAGMTTPVFGFDLNSDTLFLNGYLEVKTSGGVSRDIFSFDNTWNSDYDPTSYVTALENQTVTWFDPNNTSAGCDQTTHICTMYVDNNTGSGKPDFFAYAPTFDLNNFNDDDRLYFTWYMQGDKINGEELSLTNLVTPPNDVPEPGVLSLLGLGLMGIAYSRRKNIKA